MDGSTIISKYGLSQHQWVEKGLAGTPFFSYVYMDCITRQMKQTYGEAHSIVLNFFSNDLARFYYSHESMVRLRTSFIQKVNADRSYLREFQERWLAMVRAFDKVILEVHKTALSKLSDAELFALYSKFYDAYLTEYSLALGVQDSFSMDAHNFIPGLFERHLPADKFQEYYVALFAPVNESFISAEKRELFYLAKAARQKALKTREQILDALGTQLEEHSKKYFWIENNYAHMKVLDSAYFASKIAHELAAGLDPETEIKKVEAIVPGNRRSKQALVSQLKLPEDLINLIKIAECFTFMQDERKKYVLMSCHYLQKFLEEFSKRTGISEQQLRQSVHPEIEALLLHKKYDLARLSERYSNCLTVNTPDSYEVFEGDSVAEAYDALFKPHVKVSEFKGTCASRGYAKGPVRIIRTIHDLGKMQKGEVLVARMTRPEMMVAVKKAVAIVTDEGGITSHAAIVSREMGIPCILATNVATKILKDGDIIEVDANNGIVKLL